MTNQNSAQFDRLFQLVTAQLDGDLSDVDPQALVDLLRDDEAAQENYVQTIEDVTSLRWWCSDGDCEAHLEELVGLSRGAHPAINKWKWITWGVLAGSILVGVAAGLGSWAVRQHDPLAFGPRPESPVAPLAHQEVAANRSSDKVATLTRLRGVRWAKESPVLSELSRLPVGQVLGLEAGEAEIFFDQEVQLVVRGPASIEICSSKEVFSAYGVISARVGELGKGFVIRTPRGRITDLGTEFGVSIAKKGATEIAVFRGAVDLAYGMQDLNVETRLNQGQALCLDSDGGVRRLVAINEGHFPSVHEEPRKRAGGSSIILDVRDNVRERLGAKFYRIVPGGLREDAPAYVDRQHQWNGIDATGMPKFLIDADYVMPFNRDKMTDTVEVSLTIGRPAALFVFLSPIAVVPDWLTKDFKNTGQLIGLDESGEFAKSNSVHLEEGPGIAVDTRFSIWRRDILAPTVVTLGSIEKTPNGGPGFCMYGIAAVRLDDPQLPRMATR
ncbi:MAG: FecR domain-containing protein [Pirellulales bacterium]